MVIGKLIFTNSEFQVDIQDLNFLPMSIANFETSVASGGPASSLYSWSATTSSGRVSAQTMASTHISESLASTNPQVNNEINDENVEINDASIKNTSPGDSNTSLNIQTNRRKRARRK